ncbi:MAG: tail fiber domain-containing protein [Sodalis sp. (in: enterobacteria)]|uniref:tail fiber domain-containing protein n=1 Tax=Sodalis sp. (in: enterobacteria) TaxID=1898979 RepID=UPI003F34B9C8
MKDIIAPTDSEDGLFHDGDPAGDVRGTVVYAQWLNAMQGAVIDTQTEQKNILAAAGMQPNPAQHNPLAEVIKGLIAQARQENEKRSLLRKNNGTDILDKAVFVANLGLKNIVEQAQNALDKRTNGTVNGSLQITHSVNVGDSDSGLIANDKGNVALYANNVKTGEWNTQRLHWVQDLEVGGKLTASGGATFGKAVSLSGGGHPTDILHFYGRGQSGNETRSGECRYYPYLGNPMSTEFYGADVVGSHYEHRLIINRAGGNIKWFVFKDDGSACAMQGHWQNNSDRRIKSNIAKIENGLAKVETLTGYTYVLAEYRQAGVMADELEKVLPEAVGNSGDYHESDGTVVKNVKAVAYGSITALLIEAIKDLSAKVKAQQAEIEALKAVMRLALDVAESPAQTQNMDNNGETP